MLDIRRTLYVFTLIDENRLRRMSIALLTGDRALVDVVVHEVSHSWFGNGVTSVSDSLSNTYHLILVFQSSHVIFLHQPRKCVSFLAQRRLDNLHGTSSSADPPHTSTS